MPIFLYIKKEFCSMDGLKHLAKLELVGVRLHTTLAWFRRFVSLRYNNLFLSVGISAMQCRLSTVCVAGQFAQRATSFSAYK